jgi:hypothetical protein
MKYSEFRFLKHTICRIAWRLVAKFPDFGYYCGKNKAIHLDVDGDAQAHANSVRTRLIDYVCWYEFGHDSPMSQEKHLHVSAWQKAGSGRYGHGLGGCEYDKKENLYNDIWSDRPERPGTLFWKPLEWFELPYAVHAWSPPFVHYTDTTFTDMHYRIIPELQNLNLGGNSEGSRVGKAINYHVNKKVVAKRQVVNGRVYCNRFCGKAKYYSGVGCLHPLDGQRKTCNCDGM